MMVVAVYSVKGGVGKTTAAVNIAWQAAQDCRVLLWDLDPQGAATYLLRVKPKVKGGAGALVRGATDAADAVRRTAYETLDVLPADDSYRDLELAMDAAKKSTRRIEKTLGPVARDYDVVVLDCPPSASLVAENAVRAADAVVVPLVPSPLSLRSLDQVVGIVAASARPAPVLGFLSMVDRRKTAHRDAVAHLSAQRPEVTDVVVPATVLLERMGSERAPVATFAPGSEAAKAYERLWGQVWAEVTARRAAAR